MNEKLEQASRGIIAVPAAAVQLSFPAWWPDIDHSSDVATKLIPIFGAAAGAIYMANLAVTFWRNLKAARAENAED